MTSRASPCCDARKGCCLRAIAILTMSTTRNIAAAAAGDTPLWAAIHFLQSAWNKTIYILRGDRGFCPTSEQVTGCGSRRKQPPELGGPHGQRGPRKHSKQQYWFGGHPRREWAPATTVNPFALLPPILELAMVEESVCWGRASARSPEGCRRILERITLNGQMKIL